MDGRVMVTGAAGFLGRAVVERLLADGRGILAVDRSGPKLAAAYPSPGERLVLLAGVDLTDPGAAPLLARQGPLDALVHTVGGFAGSSFLDPRPGELEAMFRLNVLPVHAAITAVLPGMVARRQGTIVVVASEAALHGAAGLGAYAASKAAVLRLVESLAAEVAPLGIAASAVLPGTLDTPPNRANLSPAAQEHLVPLQDAAEVIALLCSTAGRSLSGAAIRVRR